MARQAGSHHLHVAVLLEPAEELEDAVPLGHLAAHLHQCQQLADADVRPGQGEERRGSDRRREVVSGRRGMETRTVALELMTLPR